MGLYFRENRYQGVNAHLHSLFQSGLERYQWTSFHTSFITYFSGHLNGVLPSQYRAFSEQSLQIQIEPQDGTLPYSQPRRPDISITSDYLFPESVNPVAAVATRTWEATLDATLPNIEPDIQAVLIYRTEETTRRVVLRIELLSPSNKVSGSHYAAYLYNRTEALRSGLPLLEIDLLHETHSPILTMPRYPHDAQSYPYHVTFSDPRLPPSVKQVRSVGVSVNAPFPTIALPLEGEDWVTLPLTEAYEETFKRGRWGEDVDYAIEPPRMESYRGDDQDAIRAVMQQVGG